MSWNIADRTLNSRLLLGTARYPSPQVLIDSIRDSGTQCITVSLRRESAQQNQNHRFWDDLQQLSCSILPNTAGCHTVKDAVTTAHLARDLFDTNWIKLEVIGHDETLQPDPFQTVEAARILCDEGFEVFPYTTEDLIVAEKLIEAGCRIIMPWGSPIGTGQGLRHREALRTLRDRLPDINLIVDAGIGRPSQAAEAIEMGFDGVLLNTAVAKSTNPSLMAKAFAAAIEAGRQSYEAGFMPVQTIAEPSTPVVGVPFWHQEP
jgi:thiazole synthase